MKAELDKDAWKEIKRLDRKTRERILKALNRYAEEGYGDIRKIEGSDEFALRVGEWRIFFKMPKQEAEAIQFSAVRPRGTAYKK